jgi:hypothetical protein
LSTAEKYQEAKMLKQSPEKSEIYFNDSKSIDGMETKCI